MAGTRPGIGLNNSTSFLIKKLVELFKFRKFIIMYKLPFIQIKMAGTSPGIGLNNCLSFLIMLRNID